MTKPFRNNSRRPDDGVNACSRRAMQDQELRDPDENWRRLSMAAGNTSRRRCGHGSQAGRAAGWV